MASVYLIDAESPHSYVTLPRELNVHAMRMGPGKHLKGLTLMGGAVTPEEVRGSS